MKNKIYIGCAGFTGRDWKGIFFPDCLASKEELSYYSTRFNAVEINSTFYRKPRVTTLENWYTRSAEDFRFFVKMPKTFTHIQKLQNSAQDILEFCSHIRTGLKEKLTGFLYQFPPSFHYSPENLETVLKNIPPGFTSVTEFRHESWWRSDASKVLAERGIVFAGVSYPGNIPDEVITAHSKTGYYRLHGVPVMFKSEYSAQFLSDIAEDIKDSGRDFYVFFNNTWGTAALKNGLDLMKIIQ